MVHYLQQGSVVFSFISLLIDHYYPSSGFFILWQLSSTTVCIPIPSEDLMFVKRETPFFKIFLMCFRPKSGKYLKKHHER